MKIIAIAVLAFALPGALCAQDRTPASTGSGNAVDSSVAEMRALADRLRAQSTLSRSGQFVVFAPPAAVSRRPPDSRLDDAGLLVLEPKLLVISCERIKEALWSMLGVQGWQGKVRLYLFPARSANDPIRLVADRVQGGWVYHVNLPDCLERGRFVRTIVDVLLLELANRNAGSRSAEVPTWLAEGLSQELITTGGLEFILPPPGAVENGVTIRRLNIELTDDPDQSGPNIHRLNPLTEAQKVLRARPPLTFEQLSWPDAELLSGAAGEVYRCSAQLFAHQLMQLPDGPACFRAMLAELPRRYNWQFAFFHGFQSRFHGALDVEKWWALQLVQFAGRDLMQTWTPEESWQKLDDIVRSRIEVRTRQQELPFQTEVTLQQIVREWDAVRQTQILQRKLQELNLLRARVSQTLAVLVDDYRQVVAAYLQKRGSSGRFLPVNRAAGPITDRLVLETIAQLDALEARREALRPAAPAPVATTTAPNPGVP